MPMVFPEWADLSAYVQKEYMEQEQVESGPPPAWYRYRRQTGERQRWRGGGQFFPLDLNGSGTGTTPEETGNFIVCLYCKDSPSALFKSRKKIVEISVSVGVSDGMISRTAHAEAINSDLVDVVRQNNALLARPNEFALNLLDRLDKQNQALQKKVDEGVPSAWHAVIEKVGPDTLVQGLSLFRSWLTMKSDIPEQQLKEIQRIKKESEEKIARLEKELEQARIAASKQPTQGE